MLKDAQAMDLITLHSLYQEKKLRYPVEDLRNRGMLEVLIKNSLNSARSWLSYEPKPYDGKVILFKVANLEPGLCGTQLMMYKYTLSRPAFYC